MRTIATAIAASLVLSAVSTGAAPATPAVNPCVDHTISIDSRGDLWAHGAWAPNFVATTAGRSWPVPFFMPPGVRAQSVTCGQAFAIALAEDGSAWGVGYGASGVLGSAGPHVTDFTRIDGIPPMARIVASTSVFPFVLALDRSGKVWGWGENTGGQILPAEADRTFMPVTPRQLGIPTSFPIVDISVGLSYSMALDQSGTVWIWGTERPFFGPAGNDHTTYQIMPGLPRIAAISAGGYFALARATDGSVWSWGDNQYGSLGVGDLPSNVDAPYFFHPVPRRIPTLSNVRAISAGASHALAIRTDGSVWAWGTNATGEIGDGSGAEPQTGLGKNVPTRLATLGAVTHVFAGPFTSSAISPGGGVYMWGWNIFGKLGNGTFADQARPQAVISPDGAGFLDLTPEDPLDIPGDKIPPFGIVMNQPDPARVSIEGTLRPKAEDVGKLVNLYVFALAPASIVKDAPAWPKDGPVPCVLAQLSATGELRAFSASTLQPAVSNTVLQASQAISIATKASASQLNLATLFAGYGASASAALGGKSRSVATFSPPSQQPCLPQTPKTGWWWNSAEGGRGYSIEVRGKNVFFAAFHYDASGRASWNFATGEVSMEGAYFSGDLYGAQGGQTLTGSYPGTPNVTKAGDIILAFNDATHGTMIWPGGAVALERLPFVPNGLTASPQPDLPEAGWWWNPQENGRGFFVEWQNGYAQIAGYMYDASGNPVWYLSGGPTPDPNAFSAPLRLYGNGQSMHGAYRAPTLVNENAGTLGLRFITRDTATMTLPGGRQVPLERMGF